MQNDTYNPFASALTVLSSQEAQQWYKTQLGLLMAKSWNGLQFLGLLVVNRIQVQMGRPPLPALSPAEAPEQDPPALPMGDSTLTVDLESEAVEVTPESTLQVDSGADADVPQDAASEIETAVSVPSPAPLTAADLEAMTVQQLRTMARQHKLTFDCPISKTRKRQLVTALLSAQQAV